MDPPRRRETELDAAEIHDVLRNDRRRLSLDCLREAEGGVMSVRDLSEAVATLETDEDPPPRNKRQSVYVSLHQTHLPKLDDLGIVVYDSDAKEVRLQNKMREVEVYMDVVPKYGLSWGEYYFALGLLGMLTTLAVLLGVPGVAALGITVLASGFFVVMMLSATYQVYDQQDRLIFSRIQGLASSGERRDAETDGGRDDDDD
ncbi:hypothetical protein N0B31_08480 [Salinirubellus salinus]|uniref:DUF7344 domain-containing protein n=1 Tax=Salinirubellus salinus TaxID=1364945 RepID=A0A9E7R6Y3_9EURY|nr:hypothetical protein [Salinirubellus salinus]UWM56319.1 hypothetical protein N0B31_08480 [Salinirubellus salinus]